MKKHIYTAAIAALAIVSCTKDDVKEVNRGQAIDFHTVMTRVTETTTNSLQDIWVTATSQSETNYFTDLQFQRNGNYFTSEKSYYWPSDGSSLQFYAYSPAKENLGTVTINKTTQTVTGFTPAADVTSQVDFIVATATGSKTDADAGVGLVFDHALAQIEVKALNSNTGYKTLIKGVRIGQVVSSGDFTFYPKSWAPGSEKTDYEVRYNEPKTLGVDAISVMSTEGDNAMLVPQQLTAWDSENDKENASGGAYIAVLANIKTSSDSQVFPKGDIEYEWIATPIDTNWEDGFKYIYTLDLKEGGLVSPDPYGDDDTKPGEEVLGGNIKFVLKATSWTTDSSSSNDINM